MVLKLEEIEEKAEDLDKRRTSTISTISLINDTDPDSNPDSDPIQIYRLMFAKYKLYYGIVNIFIMALKIKDKKMYFDETVF